MNRWTVPVAAAALAALVLGAELVPAPTVPQELSVADNSQVSVICPGFSASSTVVTTAAASGEGPVLTTPVDQPDQVDSGDSVVVSTSLSSPVRISGPRQESLAAAVVAVASSGPNRGLAAVGCTEPSTDQWIVGAELSESQEADLLLVNTDSTPAVVDVAVVGEQGRLNVPGSRGIVVAAHDSVWVALSSLVSTEGAVSVQVETSAGRVAASLRQRSWSGEEVLGVDWVPLAVAPAATAVIPFVPAEAGTVDLIVTNPGERFARVQVEFLGSSGPLGLAGAEAIDVPAGSTRSLSGLVLAGMPAGVRLTSEQPVTAAVRATSADGAAGDTFYVGVAAPLGGAGRWVVPAGRARQAQLVLVNPGAEEVTTEVESRTDLAATSTTETVTVPASGSATVDLPKAVAVVIDLQDSAAPLMASVVVSGKVGSLDGLAVVGLSSQERASAVPALIRDPGLRG